MRRPPTRLIAVPLAIVAALSAGAWLFTYTMLTDFPPPPLPSLSGAVEHGTLAIDGHTRSYLFYVPARLAARPGLLIALHGARGSGRRMRVLTAYEFDALADANNFIVVYPDGIAGLWNDCRRALAERRVDGRPIDDVAFLRALIDRFAAEYGVAPGRFYVMGFSNGGEMAYRMAVESPESVGAIAVVAANFPTAENSVCAPSQWHTPTMIINGTDDPVNPYGGGRSGWFGLGRGGPLRSSLDTAEIIASLAGHMEPPQVRRGPHHDADSTWVERTQWSAPGLPEVVLYTAHGGGHTIPQSKYRLRRVLGGTVNSLDAMQEIWEFFRLYGNPL